MEKYKKDANRIESKDFIRKDIVIRVIIFKEAKIAVNR